MRGLRQPVLVLGFVGVFGVILVLLAIQSQTAVAQIVVTLDTCKSVRRVAAPQSDELLSSQCGRRFSSRDPYIAIVTRVRDVVQIPRLDAVVQIFDPDQTLVASYRWGEDVDPDRRFEIWDVAILPIATSPGDLAAQLPNLQEDIVPVRSGRAFRERLGTWTVRVTVNRQSYPFSFTLEGP